MRANDPVNQLPGSATVGSRGCMPRCMQTKLLKNSWKKVTRPVFQRGILRAVRLSYLFKSPPRKPNCVIAARCLRGAYERKG